MSSDSLFPPGYVPDVRYDSPYGYRPTFGVTILFTIFFAITGTIHGVQAFTSKLWWMFPTLFTCGLVEVIGWSGRIWSSKNPWIMDPYLMQIVCTIIAPTFMTAGMFIIFGKLIGHVGYEYSRLKPKVYAFVFIGADVAALVVQSVGGAKASMAATFEESEQGARIMVGGIFVQMAAITGYVIVQGEYLFRVYKNKPIRGREATPETGIPLEDKSTTSVAKGLTGMDRITPKIKHMIIGLVIATVLIYVRSIYRAIELLDGWHGKIITNEQLFDVLDGTPIFLAMLTLNWFHPGRLLPTTKPAVAAV